MTIPSTGSFSFQTLENEFGGTGFISLSEYYRNGPYTTANNTNVPTSGLINMGSFRGATKGVYMTYEIIGAGGGGGSGWTTANNGTDGQASTLTYTPAGGSSTTITSPGGRGGRGGIQTGWGAGSNSYYGSGGAGGANSDSSNQTAGYPAPSTSYGAGGGGGGANPFSARNGGEGGFAGGTNGTAYNVYAWNSSTYLTRYVGMPSTGTVLVTPGQTVSIYIGVAGTNINPDPGTDGRAGANGYCKLTVNGTDYIYTATGTHTFTVPS